MQKELVDLFICPECLPEEHGLACKNLQLEGQEIISGQLVCKKCGHCYPIAQGVPDLRPGAEKLNDQKGPSKYETDLVISSYLWSHYADLFNDPEANDAYQKWSDQLDGVIAAGSPPSLGLDIGCAVGRFSFEMRRVCGRVIGVEYSPPFVHLARKLLKSKKITFQMTTEGELSRDQNIELPQHWETQNITFIIADALCLPFPENLFNMVSSLNILDKVSQPLTHLTELNRVSRRQGAWTLISDPFSWSTEFALKSAWLGGTGKGPFAGHGFNNVKDLLTGKHPHLNPHWTIDAQGHIGWKIRNHQNHYEMIRSHFIKASR